MNRITIQDIANEAGVSKATVSRVLNHPECVDQSTRNRVLRVMEKRNYSPSSLARSLSRRQTQSIGVIIPEIDNPFFGRLLRAVMREADRQGFALICCDTDNDTRRDLQAFRMLLENRVRGILYTPAFDYPARHQELGVSRLVAEAGIPTVLIDRKAEGLALDGIYFENFRASHLATRILLAAGHRQIAVVGGYDHIGLAQERIEGYRAAMAEAGAAVPEGYVQQGDFSVEAAYGLTRRLLDLEQRPTAVLTCNNNTALGFLQALADRGLSSGRDIVHLGYDELDALDCLRIPYNHILRSTDRMAAQAVQLLLSREKDRTRAPQSALIPPLFALEPPLQRVALDNGILTPDQLHAPAGGRR